MLKLSEIRDAYERSSARLGELNRQLCFAGFAVVWIFNKTSDDLALPSELYWPMVLWCISLSLDVLQYLYKTITWWLVYLHHKNKTNHKLTSRSKSCEDSVIIDESEKLNAVTWILFFMKIGFMTAGYVLTIKFIFSKIF